MAFKTSGSKNLKLYFKHFKCSNVSLRNSNNESKGKQGNAISRVVERECNEFLRESPSKNIFVYIHCIGLENIFIRIPPSVCIYISTY